MKKLAFYNHYHNGDLFASRGWIEDICKTLDYNPMYYHVNNPSVLKDLPVIHSYIPELLSNHEATVGRFVETDDTIFINTWIGSCLQPWSTDDRNVGSGYDVNYKTYHEQWKIIYHDLNMMNQMELEIDDNIWKYISNPNYTKYHISGINKFLCDTKTRILISNGPVHSGQSYQTHDMSSIMLPFVEKYPETQFIFTWKTPLTNPNVFYTDDLTVLPEDLYGDLNEIAYLSHSCDVVIGKNSGPFCFCMTKANLTSRWQTFISLGRTDTEVWTYGMQIPASFYYLNDNDDNRTSQFIETILHSQSRFK